MFLEKRISFTFLTPSYVRMLGGQTGPFLKKLIVGRDVQHDGGRIVDCIRLWKCGKIGRASCRERV